jgi:predicted Rossmann-fold nucleotide-binding protein
MPTPIAARTQTNRAKPPVDTTPPAETKGPPGDTIGTNRKQDDLKLNDADLQQRLNDVYGDASKFVSEFTGPLAEPGATIYGTARSQGDDPNGVGFVDFAWGKAFGAALAKKNVAIHTGGGGGAMTAPLQGAFELRLLEAARKNKLPAGGDLSSIDAASRNGSNVILPFESKPSPFIGKGNVQSYNSFAMRETAEMENADRHVITPGGFGTTAEAVSVIARRARGDLRDPIVFGAPDDFFTKLNAGLAPLLNENERGDLAHVYNDPDKAARAVAARKGVALEESPAAYAARLRDDFEVGLQRLDQGAPAVSFFGGDGPRTQAAAQNIAALASALADKGVALRVGGSKTVDDAVKQGVAGKSNVELQGFALPEEHAQDDAQVKYTPISDLAAFGDVMGTRAKGMVFVADGATSMSVLLNNIVDMQTKKKPDMPVVVFDPDGKFAEFMKTASSVMISDTPNRKYISPDDLARITITNDPAKAAAVLAP